jgi:hypothetical protein
MKNAILSVTLVLLILTSGFYMMSVECRVPSDKQELLASCFYPEVHGLAHSLPYLYVKKDDVLHIRSAETGILLGSVPVDATEELILYDEDSVFTINTDNSPEDTAIYRRIDADGSIEDYTMPYIDMSEFKSSEYEFHREHFVLDNEPVVIYIENTFDDIKDCLVECRMHAESPSGTLWERVLTDGEYFSTIFDANRLSYKGVLCVYKGNKSPGDKSSCIMIIDVSTGDTIYYTDELKLRTIFSAGNKKIGVFYDEERVTTIIDLNDGRVIYEYSRESTEPNIIETVDDSIWITKTQYGHGYRYGVTDAITLQKLDLDGEIDKEIQFIPKTENTSINYSKILNDNSIILLSNYCTYLYNFRTNQRLAVIPYKVDSMYMHDNTLVYQTDRRLVALDTETFEKRWELESVDLERVEMVETEDQLFFGYRYTADTEGCGYGDIEYRMLIRVVNKSTGYQEPYEYDIPFQYNGMDFIYPSPYGLIAIDRYRLYCWAPGNVLVYEIGGIDHPEEIIETDDRRYINIRCVPADNYSYVCRLDIKTGLITVIERHYGDD